MEGHFIFKSFLVCVCTLNRLLLDFCVLTVVHACATLDSTIRFEIAKFVLCELSRPSRCYLVMISVCLNQLLTLTFYFLLPSNLFICSNWSAVSPSMCAHTYHVRTLVTSYRHVCLTQSKNAHSRLTKKV